MTKKILIINGPNLNLLGDREKSKYGSVTLEDVKKICEKCSKSIDLEIQFNQSNIEGEIVTMIQKAKGVFDGIIINAAGYTHTSVAILDALLAIKLPTIEIHITNYNEEFIGYYEQKSILEHNWPLGGLHKDSKCYNKHAPFRILQETWYEVASVTDARAC